VLQSELYAAEERLAAQVASSELQLSGRPVGSRHGFQRLAGEEVRDLVARLEFEEEALCAALEKKNYSTAASLQGVVGELEAELEEARRSGSQAMPWRRGDESLAAEAALEALLERLGRNEAAICLAVDGRDYREAGTLQSQRMAIEAEMHELRSSGSSTRSEILALTTELESEEAALEVAVRSRKYEEAAAIQVAVSCAEAQLQVFAGNESQTAAECASHRDDIAKAEAALEAAALDSAAAKLAKRQGAARVSSSSASGYSFGGKGSCVPVAECASVGGGAMMRVGKGDSKPAGGSVVVQIEQCSRADAVLYQRVTLQNVRVLALSKASKVPGGKGKGKSKGNVQECGVRVWRQGSAGHVQECGSVYLGQDGHVVCVVAFGEAVANLPGEDSVGALVDVIGAKPRVGQVGALYAEPSTRFVNKLEPTDCGGYPTFPYITEEVCDTFGSWARVQEVPLGTHIDLVLSIFLAEERSTQDSRQERYLSINGADMDSESVGPVLLWGYAADEVQCGHIYIIRGLKVVMAKRWSDEDWKYVPRTDGARSLDCTYRTAVEDVSEVRAITRIFGW